MSLPTPYYEQDGITLYCGDCRDIIPSLHFDCWVTDPPYGVDFQGKNTKYTKRNGAGYTTEDNATIGIEVVSKLLQYGDRGIVFPGTRQMFRYPEPQDVGCVYCPSGAGMSRWGFALWHPVFFYGKRPPRTGVFPNSLTWFGTTDASGHPCPKPLRWMTWAVNMVSLYGEKVVDPFAGSGTTLVAAKQLGRKAIGIEIEERYCEIAVKRLAQGCLELTP